MKNLFKYELRKTLIPKLMLLGMAALVEIFFLVSLFGNKPTQLAISVCVFIVLGIFGIVFIGIQSLLTLHRDMNTRQGYMLFMTPNSSSKILGAKTLENTCSTIVVGVIFFLVGLLDVSLIKSRNQDINETLSLLKAILSGFSLTVNYTLDDIIFFTFYMVISWLSTIMIAYFADILVSSVLNGKKYSLLLGFALFLAFSFVENQIGNLLPNGNTLLARYGISAVFYIVITVITFFGSAKLMDRHLSI